MTAEIVRNSTHKRRCAWQHYATLSAGAQFMRVIATDTARSVVCLSVCWVRA